MKKIKNKILDFFDVIKYKRQRNTAMNKYNARNDDYISSLETIQILVIQNMEYQKQIEKLKSERKELKRIIEEDMTPKKKKRSK